jgi:lysophospholipase L1-like esterase
MASRAAAIGRRVALPMLSIVIFLATGELALRIVYRDGGRLTLGAPGFQRFAHVTVHDQQRGRLEWGEKRPNVPRVMILGDSITWGTGVRDWQEVWPEQLARLFDEDGRPHEWAVLSLPGRDIDSHIVELRLWADEVQPDVLIYQWYVNDIEIAKHRPEAARRWQRHRWHEPLRRASYLYYFLDNRMTMFLPPPERSYVDYILTDFVPGTFEWADFEREFHELATRARDAARLRVLVLYPQVPFRGQYPLESIHDRMKALARAESLSIPPAAWIRQAGIVVALPDARWKQAVQLPPHSGPRAIVTRGYYARRRLDVTVSFRAVGLAEGSPAATLEAVDLETGATLAAAPLVVGSSPHGLEQTHLRLTLPDSGREVQLAIGGTAARPVDLASIDLGVNYGFEVVDLTETMNAFDTHVSIFDAHPNRRAHRVIAERLFEELTKLETAYRDGPR